MRPQNEILELVNKECIRQSEVLQLVASENLPTPLVNEVLRYPLLSYKTAEGLSGRRYHGGCEVVDKIEKIAIEKSKKLFEAQYANVQPNTATTANQAVFKAILKPESKVLSMGLRSGGHLSHNAGGLKVHTYDVDQTEHTIDYDEVERIAKEVRPDLIIAGASSYPREIDFGRFRDIADEIGAYLMADIAHIAGLVAGKIHNSPIDYAHLTTLSTYKTLRGPRSGIILSGKEYKKRIGNQTLEEITDKALFPGVQGSPNMSYIAAKAACFTESIQPWFTEYVKKIVENSKALAETFKDGGYKVLTNGTDNHIVLVDVTPNGLTGKVAEESLGDVKIVCNKNLIPYDKKSPQITSGVRFGTQFLTSRGIAPEQMKEIGNYIIDVWRSTHAISDKRYELDSTIKEKIKKKVSELAHQYPINLNYLDE